MATHAAACGRPSRRVLRTLLWTRSVKDWSSTRPASRLRHIPEEGQRSLHDAGHVLAPGLVAEEEAGRREDDVVERGLVEASDRRLLLVEVLGVEPGIDLGLD